MGLSLFSDPERGCSERAPSPLRVFGHLTSKCQNSILVNMCPVRVLYSKRRLLQHWTYHLEAAGYAELGEIRPIRKFAKISIREPRILFCYFCVTEPGDNVSAVLPVS